MIESTMQTKYVIYVILIEIVLSMRGKLRHRNEGMN